MSWRDEDHPTIDKEKYLKRHIKNELMNYYLYLSEYYELRDQKFYLYDKSVGGSIIPLPDGTGADDSIQHRAVMRESEIGMLQEPCIEKLDMIDSWISVLTRAQYEVIKVYVMRYQCENAHEAAIELRYEEDTVKKHTKRAIDRIYSRIKKIL